jgi:hypothetical protein
VLQYIAPRNFAQLREPLLNTGNIRNGDPVKQNR